MTDRVNALIVVLENNVRTDDIQRLVEAIQQFRGVINVEVNVADPESHIAFSRAKSELTKKLFQVLD